MSIVIFFSENLLMLGKTYLKLKKEDEARYYLNLAKDCQGNTEEDEQVSNFFCVLPCMK